MSKQLALVKPFTAAELEQIADMFPAKFSRDERTLFRVAKEKGQQFDLTISRRVTRLTDLQRRYFFAMVNLIWRVMVEGGVTQTDEAGNEWPITREHAEYLMRLKFLSATVKGAFGGSGIDEETGEVLGRVVHLEKRLPLSLSRNKGVSKGQMAEAIDGLCAFYTEITGMEPPKRDTVAEVEENIAISAMFQDLYNS